MLNHRSEKGIKNYLSSLSSEQLILSVVIRVQLNLFLVFVLNYLSYNFTYFCENVFNFGLIAFVSYYFEIRESFHHFGLWPCN